MDVKVVSSSKLDIADNHKNSDTNRLSGFRVMHFFSFYLPAK